MWLAVDRAYAIAGSGTTVSVQSRHVCLLPLVSCFGDAHKNAMVRSGLYSPASCRINELLSLLDTLRVMALHLIRHLARIEEGVYARIGVLASCCIASTEKTYTFRQWGWSRTRH